MLGDAEAAIRAVLPLSAEDFLTIAERLGRAGPTGDPDACHEEMRP